MATGPTYAVKFRRRREGKTDYRCRLALLKSSLPRLVIRRTNQRLIAQIITSRKTEDYTLASASSTELRKLGWVHKPNNTPAAYLTGYLLARRYKNKSKLVVDLGRHNVTSGARILAVLSGALDAGLEFAHSTDRFPSKDRLDGAHISKDIKGDISTIKSKIDAIK